jgi:hypothetical protein
MSTGTIVTAKPYSSKELAQLYGVCDKTFKKWLQPFTEVVGTRQGRYYTIAQVRVIFEKLGEP